MLADLSLTKNQQGFFLFRWNNNKRYLPKMLATAVRYGKCINIPEALIILTGNQTDRDQAGRTLLVGAPVWGKHFKHSPKTLSNSGLLQHSWQEINDFTTLVANSESPSLLLSG